MYSIITGTILLGITHALIPNHWLPLVAIARSENPDSVVQYLNLLVFLLQSFFI